MHIVNKIIIIGAGLAGMVAALAAHEEGAEVIIVDRGSIGLGTNTALAGGVFTGPTGGYDTETYIKDTIQIGRMINNPSMVRLIAETASGAFDFLRSSGLPVMDFHSITAVRTLQLDQIPGLLLVKNIAEKIGKLDRVTIFPGFYVTDIIKDNSRACGVEGFNNKGEEITLFADAVIIAAGGAGAVYLVNDNQKNTMGQGYWLAAKAGLELFDMEFVQFYPLVLADKHLPSMILYPPFPEEVRLLDSSGKDILKKHSLGSLNEAIHTKRDRFSSLLFEETSMGGAYADFSNVPLSLWDKYPQTLLSKLKFPVRTKPVPISPAAHFFMGGVKIDEGAGTAISGLFACGEIAWGLHGASRRGGNALTECLVIGKIAGQNAARYTPSAITCNTPAMCDNLRLEKNVIAASISGLLAMTSRRSPEKQTNGLSLKALRRQIREVAWNNAGVVRSEKGLKEGLAATDEIDTRLQTFIPKNVQERRLKEDLLSASFVLKVILIASLGRKESRGSFQRKDFPNEDNGNWQKNSCLSYDPEQGDFSLHYI